MAAGGGLGRLGRFYSELQRRRALRALGAYAVGVFALLQVIEPVVHGLALPEWVIRAAVIASAAGFPVAFVLAWTFDITSAGIRRTPDLPSPHPAAVAPSAPAVHAGSMTALLGELARAPEVALEELRPLRPGDTVGRFEILREIGRGGFGVVYEARDSGLGRLVALKTIQPRRGVDVAIISAEAEAAAQLQHPNIVTVHDLGTEGGRAWMVLELLRGETLQERLRRGPLPMGEALRTSLGLARGLAHAHRNGVIHRDLKSANVFLCEDGTPKILDFGLSRVFGTGGAEGGTPGYMAPEQVRGEPQDARTDVFAAAVLLYETLTGQRPYPVVDGRSSVLDAQRSPRLSVVRPPALRKLLATALHPDPARRPRDGSAWLEGLLAVESAAVRQRSRRTLATGATLSAVAAAAILAFTWRQVAPRHPATPQVRVPVAVADVRNGTSDPELDGLSGMLVTSLEQSPGLNVLTRSRLVDAIKQLGKEPPAVVDEPLAREIGRALGVKALLLATVHRFDDVYALELRALDPTTNEYLFTLKEQARGKSSVPELIDRLARTAYDRLAEDRSALEGPRRAVAELTTPNLAAYERYFNARRAIDLRQFDVARRELDAALAQDPSFALAHYARTVLDSWTHPLGPAGLDGPDATADRERLDAAVRLVDRLPERERLGLLAWKATADGDNDTARRLRDEAARAYPQDKDAVFWAGDQRYHSGDVAGAIPYFEQALALDPDYRIALEHVTRAYAQLGKHDQELAWARRWADSARTPESRLALGRALLAHDRLEDAERAFTDAAGAPFSPPSLLGWLARHGRLAEAETRARATLAAPLPAALESVNAGAEGGPKGGVAATLEALLVYQGRVREAERVSSARLAGRPEKERLTRHLVLAIATRDPARATAAARALEEAKGPVDGIQWAQAVVALGIAGQTDAARVLEPRIRASREWPHLPPTAQSFLGAVAAWACGRPGEAEQGLRVAANDPIPGPAYQAASILGELLVADGRPREALPFLQRAAAALRTQSADEFAFAEFHPHTLVALARAHEALGDRTAARAALAELRPLVAHADADLPIVAEARALEQRLGPGDAATPGLAPAQTTGARP